MLTVDPPAVAGRTPVERRCDVVAVALVVSGLIFLVIAAVGTRPWTGPVSWGKPATFGVSFGLTLATVVRVSALLTMPVRTRSVLLGTLALDSVVEVAGVTVQAVRGVPSHLNRSTPANTAVSMTLAVGGAVLVVVLGRLAWAAFAGATDAAASMRLALRAGFALLLCGLASGAAMIARGTVAMNTGSAAHAYAVTGSLKTVHGITLHGIVVVPLFAWWLARRDLDEGVRVRWVAWLVALYAGAALTALVVALI